MRKIVSGRHVVDWVAKRTNEFGHFGTETGIGLERDGRLIAGVAYAAFNGVNMECHIASDGSKNWMTRDYLRFIFDYPFNQAKVNRITVCIGEGNVDSWRFVYHLGFELEATLQSAHPTGDLLVFRMFKEGCQWLSPGFEKKSVMAVPIPEATALRIRPRRLLLQTS